MVFGWGKKRVEREAVVTRTVAISEVAGLLDSVTEAESSRLLEQTKRLQRPVLGHIESLLKIATAIEKDQLNTDEIDTNIITIVKRGKKQVLDAIHKESERQFPDLNSVDDVKEFNRLAAQTLSKIGNVLGKQTRVIHLFAKKYAGKLKEILARLKEDLEHSDRLLDRFLEFEGNRDKVSDLIQRMALDQDTISANADKISGLGESISGQREELSALEHKISEFKASPDYEKCQRIRRQLDSLGSKKSRIESEINNQTILISRPVSKYGYGSSLDKKDKIIVEKLLASPLEVFLPANKDSISMILQNIRKAITLNHISVKDPEKTIGHIDEIASKIDGFIGAVESLVSEQKALGDELEALDMDILEGHQRRHSKILDDIAFAESKIRDLEGETASLKSARPAQIRQIESLLNCLGSGRYSVTG